MTTTDLKVRIQCSITLTVDEDFEVTGVMVNQQGIELSDVIFAETVEADGSTADVVHLSIEEWRTIIGQSWPTPELES